MAYDIMTNLLKKDNPHIAAAVTSKQYCYVFIS